MLDVKHTVRQLVIMRNRGQVTALPYENQPIVLAKASVSPPVPKEQHNDYVLELFLNRTPDLKTEIRPFVSIRQQWVGGDDFVRHPRSVRLNLEPDLKRKPIAARMGTVRGVDHLVFDTAPWSHAEEGLRARVIFDQWRRTRCLKNMADWHDWIEFYRFTVAVDRLRQSGQSRGINFTEEGAVGVLRRLFLRAYAKEALGLCQTLNYRELAQWLTAAGYPTRREEVQNAKRAKLVEAVVPDVAAVRLLLDLLLARFPSFQGNRLLALSEL